MKRFALTLSIVVAFTFFALPAFAGDFIKLKTGEWHVVKPESGSDTPSVEDHEASGLTVLEEFYDRIAFSVKVGDKSTRQDYDTAKIGEVFYQKPDAYEEAAIAYENGELQAALQAFAPLSQGNSLRPPLRMHALVTIARIYCVLYQWPQAIAAWEKLLTDFPKSRFAPEALIQIGLAYVNQENADKARDAFGRLQKLSGLADSEKMLARYYLSLIKQKQGEKAKNNALITEAMEEYKVLLAEVEKNPGLKNVATLAKLGIGNCLIALGRYADALTFFKSIADSTEDRSVLAGVFNGLGMCYFKTEKWKDALLAFLRVEVLYKEDAEQAAMALFYTGKCFEFMQGANIGIDNAIRAKAQYRKCMALYGGTVWGKAAQEALPNVRGK